MLCDMDLWLYIGLNGCLINWKVELLCCIGVGGSCLNEFSGCEMGCEGSFWGEFFFWWGLENGEVDLYFWMGWGGRKNFLVDGLFLGFGVIKM